MNERVMHKRGNESPPAIGVEDDVSDFDLIVTLQREAPASVKNRAYESLLDLHYKRFYYLAFRLLQNAQDAEDCVQDCFLKLWRKPNIWKVEGGASFQTFFTHIVVNRARDMHRKGKFLKLFTGQNGQSGQDDESEDIVMQASASLTTVPQQQPQEYIDEKQKALRLQKAMLALPLRQREAVTLCFYEELSNAEAANIMGVGVKALESLLMRAKKNLRDILKHKEGEE